MNGSKTLLFIFITDLRSATRLLNFLSSSPASTASVYQTSAFWQMFLLVMAIMIGFKKVKPVKVIS